MSRTPSPLPPWRDVVAVFEQHGIEHVGVARADVLRRARRELHRRKALGLSADMGFTYRNPDRSTDPSRAVKDARSIIVAALPYSSSAPPASETGGVGRVARYAWIDYYQPLRNKLRVVADMLRNAGERAVVFADDNSVVDREVAFLGGLGWFGKNANLLIAGGGSYFVLGSIITTADYTAHLSDNPVPDGCGPCRRCIDACPTGAIVAPGVVDARRCLAWLLQAPGDIPVEYRVALGDRFYGCDDCQHSCPPAERLGARYEPSLPDVDPHGDSHPPQQWVDLHDVLTARDEALLERYGRWYIAQRDPRWWRRNALVILGNTAQPDDGATLDLLEAYRQGADSVLAEHASWALHRLAQRRTGRDRCESVYAVDATSPQPISVPVSPPTGSGRDEATSEQRATRVTQTSRTDPKNTE